MITSLKPVIKVDAEKCVSCHQCISVCPSKYCNNGSGDHIEVNPDLCIGCGACLEACPHEARQGIDDLKAFLDALRSGKKVIAIVAPAVAANFPENYLRLNAWLKSIGVQAIFDVSFGAELTIKSYLEAIKTKGLKHVVAQPCPALVGYIELYHPELLQYLAPADSPMMHTIRMVREFYPEGRGAEFVILSPCYAKRREFDEVGLGEYNVTFKSIDNYLREQRVDLHRYEAVQYDNPDAERAVLFSTPGGLMRTAQREVPGIENSVRKIEGPHTIYKYLDNFEKSVIKGNAPLLVDCLNCEMGCNGGAGTLNVGKPMDEVEHLIEKRSREAQERYREQAGLLGKKFAVKRLHKHIDKHWRSGLYDRRYTNREMLTQKWVRKPDGVELDKINRSMYKFKQDDLLNCCSCGYNSCEQMATAIYNGLNKPENCRHYQEIHIGRMKEESQREIVEQRRHTITDIVNSFQGVSDRLVSVAGASTQMSATINEISATASKAHVSTTDMSAKSGSVTSVMRQLADATREITGIIKTIAEIADQTNLLALNATIEAASAGDEGKGFAVVAAEVKELARRTALATEDIRQKIEGVQNFVTNAVSNVDSISENIHHSDTLITGIAVAIEQQSSVTRQVSSTISDLLAAVKKGISDIQSSAAS